MTTYKKSSSCGRQGLSQFIWSYFCPIIGKIYVCGTPWNGKHKLGTNANVPLRAVGKIVRDEANHTVEMSENDKWPLLIGQCYRPESMPALEHVLRCLERMKKELPFYEIHCDMRQEAVQRAWEAMKVTERYYEEILE